jgi:hypothetical protein
MNVRLFLRYVWGQGVLPFSNTRHCCSQFNRFNSQRNKKAVGINQKNKMPGSPSSPPQYTDAELLSAYVKEYRRLEELSKRSFDMMSQALSSPFTVASRQCEEMRTAVVNCYQQNGTEVYRCKDDLQAFSKCAEKLLSQHVSMVNDFQTKRVEHRKTQEPL